MPRFVRTSFSSVLVIALVAAACSGTAIDETFVVPSGQLITYTFTVPSGADVELRWESVNRNVSGETLGGAGVLLGQGSVQVGAADGTPGDINITLSGPGIERSWPRSVRSSVRLTAPEGGGTYQLTFSNGFSVVTAKEIRLTGTVR